MARAAAYTSILSAFNQYLLTSFPIAIATALTAVMGAYLLAMPSHLDALTKIGCDMVLALVFGSAFRTIYVETVFWFHPSDINSTAPLTDSAASPKPDPDDLNDKHENQLSK